MIASLVLLAALATASPETAAKPTRCFAGKTYNVSLDQRFSDLNVWRYENGGDWFTAFPWGRTNPGARDAAYYMDASLGLGDPVWGPFSISRDALQIEADPVSSVPGLLSSQIGGMSYVSGTIVSTDNSGHGFRQIDGYYEVKMQLPKGQGIWPAFWMLDTYGSGAETDVLEFLGNDLSTIHHGVHYANGTNDGFSDTVSFDPTAGFHRYGVLIDSTIAKTETFYVDGVKMESVPDGTQPHGWYLLITLQIGGAGSWPGPPDGSTPWPSQLLVRYVHAYTPTAAACKG